MKVFGETGELNNDLGVRKVMQDLFDQGFNKLDIVVIEASQGGNWVNARGMYTVYNKGQVYGEGK